MNKHIITAAVGAVAAVSGFGLGYFVAKTRMEALMELRLKDEIESVKEAFNRGQKAGEFATPESAVNALIDPEEQAAFLATPAGQKFVEDQFQQTFGRTSQDGDGFTLEDDVVITGGEVVNVFEQAPVLVAGYPNPTDENAPYLITVDQFHEENDHYDKNSIVYYAGDLVLADETEAEIHDIPGTVAPDFMDHFGEMSLDENIVYYRNDRLAIDFEISRDHGLYAEKVLGIVTENEVAESFQKIARKKRVRDDRDD